METQYWALIDIPRQEKQETVPSYVMRACSIMEKTQKSGEGVKTSAKLAEEAAEKRERMERLERKYFCNYQLYSPANLNIFVQGVSEGILHAKNEGVENLTNIVFGYF